MSELTFLTSFDHESVEREIHSMIEAYALAPWGEEQTYADADTFVQKIHSDSKAFTAVYTSKTSGLPYLYIHGIDYDNDIESMVQEEFVGPKAYWRVAQKDSQRISQLLHKLNSAVYINNIHADKAVTIKQDEKPRLKIIPELIDRLFEVYNREAIVLFTNHNTGVYRALQHLGSDLYQLTQQDYQASCAKVTFNNNHSIDYLTLVVIKKK